MSDTPTKTYPPSFLHALIADHEAERAGARSEESSAVGQTTTRSTFEAAVKEAAEQAVLRFVAGGQWVMPDYQSRVRIPDGWMQEMWRLVDADRIRAQVAQRVEAELAERIVNHIAAELATDIKQILSVKERREAIRALARQHMESLMTTGGGTR